MKFLKVFLALFCVATLTQCNKTPDLKFTSINYIDGNEIKSVEIGEGKKTVIHFYASWCGDCRREMPDANNVLYNAPDDVRIYYLTDDSSEKKEAMEKKYSIPFPTYNLEGSINDVGVVYLPLTYFIDENGQQVLAQAEQIDWHSNEIKTFLGY
ncbi:MAG: TlpA family protein disulfide reductase [Flavobacteriales bacterium]